MEKKSIGSFLTALRKASGFTQKQLAEKLNVSDKAVSRWERDECAPDLSLIPVLAEIYGVTSDEILRGQRANPEKLYQGVDRTGAEKQRLHILKSVRSKFISRSLVTVALALVGVILAYILNTEFEKANTGFLIGSIFFIVAAVSQAQVLIAGFASVRDEDWVDSSVEHCKGLMLLASQWCGGIVAAAIGFCIPLAGKRSILLEDCVLSGVLWTFVLAAAWLIVNIAMNLYLHRKGIVDLKQPLNKLRNSCGMVLAVILVILLGLQSGLCRFLDDNKHLYAPHETYTDVHQFAELMEEPKTEEGFSMRLIDESGGIWAFYVEEYDIYTSLMPHGYDSQTPYLLHEDDILKELVPTGLIRPGYRYLDEKHGYQFNHLNRTIAHYEIDSAKNVVPIYTFNIQQLEEANQMFVSINLCYLLTYALAIVATFWVYNMKKRNL